VVAPIAVPFSVRFMLFQLEQPAIRATTANAVALRVHELLSMFCLLGSWLSRCRVEVTAGTAHPHDGVARARVEA
jgi:hypothetical protein